MLADSTTITTMATTMNAMSRSLYRLNAKYSASASLVPASAPLSSPLVNPIGSTILVKERMLSAEDAPSVLTHRVFNRPLTPASSIPVREVTCLDIPL